VCARCRREVIAQCQQATAPWRLTNHAIISTTSRSHHVSVIASLENWRLQLHRGLLDSARAGETSNRHSRSGTATHRSRCDHGETHSQTGSARQSLTVGAAVQVEIFHMRAKRGECPSCGVASELGYFTTSQKRQHDEEMSYNSVLEGYIRCLYWIQMQYILL
jgi:DNA-directed RNA polymerase subunit M/transcription elongation factor TFIIS